MSDAFCGEIGTLPPMTVRCLVVEGPKGYLAEVSHSDAFVGLLNTFTRDFDDEPRNGTSADAADRRASTLRAALAYVEGVVAVLVANAEDEGYPIEVSEPEVISYAQVLENRANRG